MVNPSSTLLLQPPPRQPFLRMQEVSASLAHKLSNLNTAVLAPSGGQPDEKAQQLLRDLHRISCQVTERIDKTLFQCGSFADIYLRVLATLLGASDLRDMSQDVEYLTRYAGSSAKSVEDTHQIIQRLVDEIATAGRETLGQNAEQRGTIFIPERARMVNDLASFAGGYLLLFAQISEYLRSTEKELQAGRSLKAGLPRKGDIQSVQQQWTVFSAELQGIAKGINGTRTQLTGSF